MVLSEKMIENFILNNWARISDFGLHPAPFGDAVFSQVNLGFYGIADIVCVDYTPYQILGEKYNKRIDINVFEIKLCDVDRASYLQLIKYCAGIKYLIERHIDLRKVYLRINGVLVGSGSGLNTRWVFPIPGIIDSFSLYHYNECADGIYFTDQSKYSFMIDDLPGLNRNFELRFDKRDVKGVINNFINRSEEFKNLFKSKKNG